jgi:hypothetical protein
MFLLAQNQSNQSSGHLDADHYATKYLASTIHLKTYFTIREGSRLESFLHFPAPEHILPMAPANWGPQYVSQSKTI